MAATCGLDFERRVSGPAVDVRRAIAESLREQGFQITVDQLTRLEAKRGSMLGSSLLMKKSMAMMVVFEVAAEPTATSIVAHLTDNIRNLGKTWGINRIYRDIFGDVARRIDLALAKLDGAAAQSFGEPRFWSRAAEVGVLEQANVISGKVGEGAVGAAGRMIEGSSDRTPSAWKGVDAVTFRSGAGIAVMTLADVQAQLGVAVMVVSHSGSMPANLTRDVEAFAGMVEQRLTAAAGKPAQVEVSDAQRPVLEFLHQQAQIRSELPMRELHICSTCRLEKITNPEYERLAVRNQRIGDIVAGVGATISTGGISPTFVLGQVFKLKRLDPEYVCSRCQGMEADERVVTFCPSCAELQRDVVLRVCAKCDFDFRTKAGKGTLWSALVEEEAPPETPPEAPPAVAPPADGAPGPAVARSPGPAVAPAPPGPAVASPEAPPEAPLETPAVARSPGPAVARSPGPAVAPAPPPPGRPIAGSPATIAAPAAPPAIAAWSSPTDVPVGVPLPGAHGGKVCQTCRREYPSLWRLVIQTPSGFEERFVCGTSVTCQM
ncbi:MAG: hypothetical protein ABSE70_05230, partial [Candidatus Limnocylindrales bacterium]